MPSADELRALVGAVLDGIFFEADLRERWAQRALSWLLEAEAPHLTGRSHQVGAVQQRRTWLALLDALPCMPQSMAAAYLHMLSRRASHVSCWHQVRDACGTLSHACKALLAAGRAAQMSACAQQGVRVCAGVFEALRPAPPRTDAGGAGPGSSCMHSRLSKLSRACVACRCTGR